MVIVVPPLCIQQNECLKHHHTFFCFRLSKCCMMMISWSMIFSIIFFIVVKYRIAESLFNAFATAAFFKFVIFSIFEMRYLLAIWKARRPISSGDGWETMRRELSVLYSRFCNLLLPFFPRIKKSYLLHCSILSAFQ